MPLQNRVDPFGNLHAVEARGTLMGNRGGRIHDDRKMLGTRRWASRQWIACECKFRGRHRDVWGAGYTELFFLDEVTALAAGHRPCFECRRADAEIFLDSFPFETGSGRAADMDARLHIERLDGRTKRLHRQPAQSLPEGAMILWEDHPFALSGATMRKWSFEGYGAAISRPAGQAVVLTPPSILEVLRNGYAPRWRPDAGFEETS